MTKDDQIREEVGERVKGAPSYPALLKAARSFLKSLYSNEEHYVQTRMAIYEKEPWQLLTAHSLVMNRKSARCKTMKSLADAIFKETGLPRSPQGMFRGRDGVDFSKLDLS